MNRLMPILCLFSLVAWAEPPYEKALLTGTPQLASMSALTFGPDGLLFVGDTVNAKIVAIDLDDRTKNQESDRLNVGELDVKVAALLGVEPRDVLFHDMAVNPISQNVYLSVSRGRKMMDNRWKLPNEVANADVLIRVTPKGDVDMASLKGVRYATADLTNPVSADKKHRWKNVSLRSEAITGMVYDEGRLYVAGLSNEEFASTMRVLDFPFDQARTTSLEIFHGAHGKYETHSPVRSFMPYSIDGQKHLVAAYLCTPLVVFETGDLKDKAHVKGRTVAELGYGNYPLDMVAYRQNGKDYFMIANSSRGLMRFEGDKLRAYKGSMTEEPSSIQAGLSFDPLPDMNAVELEPLNQKNLVALTVQPNGHYSLASIPIAR